MEAQLSALRAWDAHYDAERSAILGDYDDQVDGDQQSHLHREAKRTERAARAADKDARHADRAEESALKRRERAEVAYESKRKEDRQHGDAVEARAKADHAEAHLEQIKSDAHNAERAHDTAATEQNEAREQFGAASKAIEDAGGRRAVADRANDGDSAARGLFEEEKLAYNELQRASAREHIYGEVSRLHSLRLDDQFENYPAHVERAKAWADRLERRDRNADPEQRAANRKAREERRAAKGSPNDKAPPDSQARSGDRARLRAALSALAGPDIVDLPKRRGSLSVKDAAGHEHDAKGLFAASGGAAAAGGKVKGTGRSKAAGEARAASKAAHEATKAAVAGGDHEAADSANLGSAAAHEHAGMASRSATLGAAHRRVAGAHRDVAAAHAGAHTDRGPRVTAADRASAAAEQRILTEGIRDSELHYGRDRSSFREASIAHFDKLYERGIGEEGRSATDIALSQPPIELSLWPGGRVALADGRHRYTAAMSHGAEAIRAKLTRYDANGDTISETDAVVDLRRI